MTLDTFPTEGRLLGIDTGRVRIGLAVCDRDWIIASPLDTYTRQDEVRDTAYFSKLIVVEKIVGCVIGLPIHMSGEESIMCDEARAFGTWLMALTQRPVIYHDERCTSAAAESILLEAKMTNKRRKARVDQLAARIILQSYIELTKLSFNHDHDHEPKA